MQTTDARPEWVVDAVFYQIFPDRFRNGDPTNDPPGTAPWDAPPDRDHFQGGDLEGIRQTLPYLADLGVTGLYLTPIFAAGSNHRYDTHDYLRVDPALGDAETLVSLVDEMHAQNMHLVLDGVFNHAGDGFGPFQDVLRHGVNSAYREWFQVRSFPIVQDPPNYQTCGGAPFLPKLVTDHPAVAEYLIGVGTHWPEHAGIDGWRLDVPWKVPKAFWSAFREAVRRQRLDAYLVGEMWQAADDWLDVFDGVMNYQLRDHILDFCVHDDKDAEDFVYATAPLFSQPAAKWQLNLLGSHDTPRLMTVCRDDVRRAILALTALFVAPGVPMIYYGDEVGMTGENDPGCRGTMDWTNVARRQPIFQACRRLIAMRRQLAALRRGTWEPVLMFNGLLAVLRRHSAGDVLILLNPRDEQRDVALVGIPDARWRDTRDGAMRRSAGGTLTIARIPAQDALILAAEDAS